MTRREKITRTLLGYLQNISVANGYLTNIGSSVSLWGTQIIPHDEIYDLNLKDMNNQHQRGTNDVLDYEIALSFSGNNSYTNICNMILDCEKALYVNQDNLNQVMNDSGIRIMMNEQSIDIVREKDKERGYATIKFQVEHLFSEKWQPDFNNY